MKIAGFTNSLSLGGTEKAACLWGRFLKGRGHRVVFLALEDGPRRAHLQEWGIPSEVPPSGQAFTVQSLADHLAGADVIHAHSPGYPHQGDILGKALRLLPRKIPVVQTNIFGQLRNPVEDAWTDFRLFISWTSCVQAARRAGRKLDLDFFRRQSVAVYPVRDPFGIMTDDESQMTDDKARGADDESRIPDVRSRLAKRAKAFRVALELTDENVLFGRFSRPEPNKWTPLVINAFLAAHRTNPNIRLLLREPPAAVTSRIMNDGLGMINGSIQNHTTPIIIMAATADATELAISQMACDVVLHTSSIGESFGYGLAEPMALGKPVITNSVPWHDQAQIELVRHGECGLLASTGSSMKAAILRFAESSEWRGACGAAARKHILQVADPDASTDRVEMAMKCALEGTDNPLAESDLEMARKTAEYLDQHQWGHSLQEQWWSRSRNAKVGFLRWQRAVKNRLFNST